MALTRPDTLAWNCAEGRKRLFESRYNWHFFQLAHLFQPQLKPTYCGVASAVIVLNALRLYSGLRLDSGLEVAIPEDMGGGTMRYNAYSQLSFLSRETDRIKVRSLIEGAVLKGELRDFDPGMCLKDLIAKMKLHLLDIEVKKARVAAKEGADHFRQDLMAFLNGSDTYVIVNLDGKVTGTGSGGHYSPAVAYHSETDSCLVMDVAGHKHPWYWVEVPLLYQAMHTQDDGQWRGWLLVSDRLKRA